MHESTNRKKKIPFLKKKKLNICGRSLNQTEQKAKTYSFNQLTMVQLARIDITHLKCEIEVLLFSPENSTFTLAESVKLRF